MADCSHNKNPLVRNGTSQAERPLKAFSPESVEIVDKRPEHWMVWATRISDYFKKYGSKNTVVGTMQPFFGSDIAARLALVSTHPAESVPQYIRRQLDIIEENDNALVPGLYQAVFSNLFDLLFGYLKEVDRLTYECAEATDFVHQLENHIARRLQYVSDKSVAFYEGALGLGLVDGSSTLDLMVFNRSLEPKLNIISAGLSETWWNGEADWATYYSSNAAEDFIYDGLTDEEKIQYASRHNLFTGLLDEISASSAYLVKLAGDAVQKKLLDWPFHAPQYALFLAHLQLMEAARGDVNELPFRHLNYYYQDVLRCNPRNAQMDYAHVLIELSKTTEQHALPAATLFNAGANSEGNIIAYASDRETVFNKASIKQLKSIYLDGVLEDGADPNDLGRLYASPVANSADGMGAEIEGDYPAWHPLFIKGYDGSNYLGVGMPLAEIGFSVSSHYLRLAEGDRTIRIRFDVSSPAALVALESEFTGFITTEKEWLELGQPGLSIVPLSSSPAKNAVQFEFTLDGGQDPVVKYDMGVHGHRFETSEPVLKILLNNQKSQVYRYTELVNQIIYGVEIEVEVGATDGTTGKVGLKDLELHSDLGQLNPSKSFLPWGFQAKPGSGFIIGSSEFFCKPNALCWLQHTWKDPYGDLFPPSIDIEVLEGGAWKSLVTSATMDLETSVDLLAKPNAFRSADALADGYSASSNKGYLRLVSQYDFSFTEYNKELIAAMATYANWDTNDDADLDAIVPPYQPEISGFQMAYRAYAHSDLLSEDEDDFENRPVRFGHIGPFGDQERHRYLEGQLSHRLVPVILEQSFPTIVPQGALFIGIEGIHPGETTSVLFQVNEGSENPLRSKPEDHITWQYLQLNGVWADMEESQVADDTMELIKSGIIKFTVPADAGLEHTWLDDGLIWLRALIRTAPDATAELFGIHPNAVKIIRQETTHAKADLLEAPPATISKLLTPVSRVKKVIQPYSSQGGKQREPAPAFYQRISERLRHKDRAITIWDYERLILQTYPDIYRVKCLNHTKLTGSADDGTLHYNEVAPGHVTVITIPRLAENSETNPLKPYTKTSTLESIKAFLEGRSSCQVDIHVGQPLFEEVKVKCNITLRPGFDNTVYYEEQIQEELTRFLSPWAYGNGSELHFGGSIHKSVIVDFLDELYYVDFLTDVELYCLSCPDTSDTEEVTGTTGRSVLVSVDPSLHDINVSAAAGADDESDDCDG